MKPARQKADLVARVYEESRETHSIRASKLMAARVLREECPEMNLHEALAFVEQWYQGDIA